jgi:prepilin-type N-terminal cleavage/methylation domain-containing protein
MTLLELLVALAIFAIVGSALFPVINGALSSRADANARVALGGEARMILDRLEADLLANCDAGFQGQFPHRFVALASRGRDAASEHAILETTTLVARGVTAADAFVGGEDVAALSADRGDQAEVLWSIDSSGHLVRQEVRPPRIEPVEWDKIPAEVLSDRASVLLEFYEAEAWLDTWDSGESGLHHGKAPVAVRTTIKVGEDDGALELVSTVVLPVVQSSIDPRRPTGSGR